MNRIGDSALLKRRLRYSRHWPIGLEFGKAKWELEDLSLRYLREDIYLGIAKQLSQKRQQREQHVSAMTQSVSDLLSDHGIEATVAGRAKNIFSIWRKMQAKNIPIEEVHDVRAVRIIVGFGGLLCSSGNYSHHLATFTRRVR